MKSRLIGTVYRIGLFAFCLGTIVMGLTACSSGDSKGTYEDGYSAGYAAGFEAGKAEVSSNSQSSSSSDIPESGIEYTINKVSLGNAEYSSDGTGAAVVLDVTAKNVSDEVKHAFFIEDVVCAYQNGIALTECISVEGYDYYGGAEIKPGATLDGWVAYELLDETTPIELEAGMVGTTEGKKPYYGLTNPQTVDPTTL